MRFDDTVLHMMPWTTLRGFCRLAALLFALSGCLTGRTPEESEPPPPVNETHDVSEANAETPDAAPEPDIESLNQSASQSIDGSPGPEVELMETGDGKIRNLKVTRFRFKWKSGFRKTGIGHKFSSATSLSSEVEIHLKKNGQVVVVDNGERGRNDFSIRFGSEVETTTWKSTWEGTWKLSQKNLHLSLRCKACQCETKFRRLESNGYLSKNTIQPCVSKKRFELECSAESIDVQPSLEARNRNSKTQEVWRCHAQQKTDFASPSPWVLGKKGCIRLSYSFRGRLEYRDCAP